MELVDIKAVADNLQLLFFFLPSRLPFCHSGSSVIGRKQSSGPALGPQQLGLGAPGLDHIEDPWLSVVGTRLQCGHATGVSRKL